MFISPRLIALATLLLLLAVAPRARAQGSAEILFQQALEDMRRADFVTACPKLAESQKLEPRSGTLISLAFCNERLGRTATAWQNYRDASALAKTEGRDAYVEKADKLAAKLLPKLANVRIFAPAIDGLVVKLNGRPIEATALGGDVHIDPGNYTVVAEAPERRTWTQTFEVAAGARQTVTVPELELSGGITLTEPAPVPPPSESGGSGSLIAGYALLGVGAASTIVGLVLGGLVLGDKSTVEEECDAVTRQCSSAGLAASDEGATLSIASTVTFVGGLVLAGVGVTLVIVGSSDEEQPGQLAVYAAPSIAGGMIGVVGSF